MVVDVLKAGHDVVVVVCVCVCAARPSSAASDPSQPEGGADSQSSSPTSLADSGTGSPGIPSPPSAPDRMRWEASRTTLQ